MPEQPNVDQFDQLRRDVQIACRLNEHDDRTALEPILLRHYPPAATGRPS